MPKLNLGTFEIQYEESGASGEPVVIVHDSWGDRRQWDGTIARLSDSCRVLSYDRRGHGASPSAHGAETLAEQVADLSTLLSIAGRGSRHVVGSGVGGIIALKLALLRPDQVRSLNVHEPPLWGLLSSDPQAAAVYAGTRNFERAVLDRLRVGDRAGAALAHVDGVSSKPGGWGEFPPVVQASFVANAPASLNEAMDPATHTMEIAGFGGYRDPVVITGGSLSAPVFATINDHLAEAFYRALRFSYEGAGHYPHVTDPDQAARVIKEFCDYAASQST